MPSRIVNTPRPTITSISEKPACFSVEFITTPSGLCNYSGDDNADGQPGRASLLHHSDCDRSQIAGRPRTVCDLPANIHVSCRGVCDLLAVIRIRGRVCQTPPHLEPRVLRDIRPDHISHLVRFVLRG